MESRPASTREQLTLFGLWEPVIQPESPPAPEPPPPECPPTDRRQLSLGDGPGELRVRIEAACEALDGDALLATLEQAMECYPEWTQPGVWLSWVPVFDRLDHEVAAVVGLEPTRLPGMPPDLFACVHAEATRRLVARLTERGGPAASLPDGRPAAALYLETHGAEAAYGALLAASEDRRDAVTLSWLAHAAARCGRTERGLEALRDAYLLDPEAVDEALVTCVRALEVADALDELELGPEWWPALADLLGVAHLREAGTATGPLREVHTALLALHRTPRREEAGRLAQKRRILAAQPALRRWVQRR